MFDPLGFLGPVTVRCKLLMQKLWTGKQPWDTPLPEEVKNEWNALQKDLCEVVTSVKIPRYYFENSDKNKETSLHIFVDASNSAYGACGYICNEERSTLVMAKNKVSPLKGTTLPKLELMAAVLGARLARDITETMLVSKIYYWSDSQIVLYWKLLHAGVGQVIQKIRQRYWIPSIRTSVNYIVRKCVKCRKIIGKACKPPDPPPLPGDRVQELVSFSVTGIDFAGPLQVKDESKARKMYICLFTCAVVRAIHLELVPDLTTESFFLAFRRFTSRCGNPKNNYFR